MVKWAQKPLKIGLLEAGDGLGCAQIGACGRLRWANIGELAKFGDKIIPIHWLVLVVDDHFGGACAVIHADDFGVLVGDGIVIISHYSSPFGCRFVLIHTPIDLKNHFGGYCFLALP